MERVPAISCLSHNMAEGKPVLHGGLIREARLAGLAEAVMCTARDRGIEYSDFELSTN